MPKRSAGLMMYRRRAGRLEVLLVHPGGPFWARKDLGAWSIPKGEYRDPERPLDAAVREFREETGFAVTGELLGTWVGEAGERQSGLSLGFEGDCDPSGLVSNLSRMEWPPRSGREIEFPEVDRAGWFAIEDAKQHILKGQEPLLHVLCRLLGPA